MILVCGLCGEKLETAVYLHTVNTLKAMKNEGFVPAMVQVGNTDSSSSVYTSDGLIQIFQKSLLPPGNANSALVNLKMM